MVEKSSSDISAAAQARLLGLHRSGLYYMPRPLPKRDLYIKDKIDRIYTAHPEFGYRRICWYLNKIEGICINHKSVLHHMNQMGIQAIYPRPNTSRPNPLHKVFPYLLNRLNIDHPNQVWAIDITYIPVKTDWLYLVAILDWHARYVVNWQLSDGLEIEFVLDACRGALREAVPEIINSDQGSHFTSTRYTKLFLEAGTRISMDHRGRAFDNILIERLWRTVKYENVYAMGYETPREARIGIGRYLTYYNRERPHSNLGYRTPEDIYFNRQ